MSLGFYASSQAAGAPPPTPPSLYQSRTSAVASSNVSSLLLPLPGPDAFTAPAIGTLLLAFVSWTRGNNVAPGLSMFGWTELSSAYTYTGSIGSSISVFGKIADPFDSTHVTVSASNNGNMRAVAEGWSNHGGMPDAVTGVIDNGGGGPFNSNSVSAPAGSIVTTVVGGRGPSNGVVSPSWGGGASAAWNTAATSNAYIFTATETVSSAATVQHTVSTTNAQGGGSTARASLVVEPA